MTGRYENAVRGTYELMNGGDFDAVIDRFRPDVVWTDPPEFPDRRTASSREELREVWRRMFEPFGNHRFRTGEFRESEDRSFVEIHVSGEGKGSGAPVEMSWWQIAFYDRDGIVYRLDNHLDRDQALAAFERPQPN